MKNFILGVSVCFCLAAGVNSEILTIKPATPKSVLVKLIDCDDSPLIISKYIKKGYILKTVSYSQTSSSDKVILVMEKY